ncbi:endonuclease [Kaistella sp. PBT33-4]|uniref:endonuclease n=1 Tax=Kaistella sp. PBT33-4 TaxID=3032000 RepID=UPI0023D832AA|nr:endonuclease [Kaistella sp. PBT33-4]MDF0720002.1 endonuclease [Kaistella sp. PBT33-4]
MKKSSVIFILSLFFGLLSAQPPAGYYNGATGTGAQLKTQLSTIITNGHSDMGYGGLWTGYLTTDRDYFYENDGTILDIYSENVAGPDPYTFTPITDQCGNYSNEGDCYNREHIVPQSLFNEASPMKNDIHFVRATDGKVNGMRNNFPFGMVGSATFTSLNGSRLGNSVSPGFSGTVFEPIDAFKGDVARMIFYFVTRYENQLSSFSSGDMLGGSAYPGLQSWQLQQLLLWHAQDPVSQVEIARNNASYTFQGNRNPFIDNPQWVNTIWGTSDTIAPSAPAGLTAGTPTSSSVPLSWTASTDNIAVVAYDIYVNGVYHSTVSGTSATVSGLAPATAYTFHVIAKDLAGNLSPASNTVTATTGAGTPGGSCGTETFDGMPANNSGYAVRTWTSNNITWTATDARTDQTINGRAVTIRNGSLTSSILSGGINSITVTTQLKFGSTAGTFNLRVNGNIVGTIPYSGTPDTSVTTTVSNLNISGNAVISITDNSITGNRVAFDDLSWTCYTLSTGETSTVPNLSLYPNPVVNDEIFVKGTDLKKVLKADIYSADGRLVQSVAKPFLKSDSIKLKKLKSGVYFLTMDGKSIQFIVR